MRIVILTIITLFLSCSIAEAQLNRRAVKRNNKRIGGFKGFKSTFAKSKRYNFLEFSVNSMHYFGDLSPASSLVSTDLSFTRPGFSLTFGHRFGPRYTFRAGVSWGTLRGDDFKSADPGDEDAIFRYVRNLHFRNRVKELSLTAMFDLYENQSTYLNRVDWTPYAFLGFSLFHHNPQAKVPEIDVHNGNTTFNNAGEWVDLQPLGTEGQNNANAQNDPYKKVQVSVPFGVGVRVQLNTLWDFSFEIGARYLFFDYIDDVSGLYADLGTFTDPVARALSDRSQEPSSAEGKTRDFTAIGSVTTPQTYVGSDGIPYTVFAGFGSDTSPDNIRGKQNNDDFYIVTSLKFAYILKGSLRRPKWR